MKRFVRASALAVWCVLVLGLSGPGCSSEPNCGPGTMEVIDNRDRQYPEFDSDWLCLGVYGDPSKPTLPLVEPDLSGSWPKDPLGPKDPDAVARLSILLDTCTIDFHYFYQNINTKIAQIYFAHYDSSSVPIALYDRSLCVKGKTNGCDALRECYGLVEQVEEISDASSKPSPGVASKGCFDGVETHGSATSKPDDRLLVINRWMRCESIGLVCSDEYGCTRPQTPCDPSVPHSKCEAGAPYLCSDVYGDGFYASMEYPPCSDFGLNCDEAAAKVGCSGTGAACMDAPAGLIAESNTPADVRTGTACKSDTLMLSCVNGREHVEDCSKIGKGFRCLPGNGVAECGLGLECHYKDAVHCEGDSIVICDAGKIRSVNCKDLGFETCDPINNTCGPTNVGLFGAH